MKKIIFGVILFVFAFALVLVETPQTVLASMYRGGFFKKPMMKSHYTNKRVTQSPYIMQQQVPGINTKVINNNNNVNNNEDTNNVNVESNNNVTVGTPLQETAAVQPVVFAAPVVQQAQPIAQLPETGTPVAAWSAFALLPLGFILRKLAIK